MTLFRSLLLTALTFSLPACGDDGGLWYVGTFSGTSAAGATVTIINTDATKSVALSATGLQCSAAATITVNGNTMSVQSILVPANPACAGALAYTVTRVSDDRASTTYAGQTIALKKK